MFILIIQNSIFWTVMKRKTISVRRRIDVMMLALTLIIVQIFTISFQELNFKFSEKKSSLIR